MKKQKSKQNLIIVIISIMILVVAYVMFNITMFFKQPTDTVLIKNGEIIKYEEVVRIRDS